MIARPARSRRTRDVLFTATGSVLLLAIAAFAAVSLFALRSVAYRQSEENLRQFSYALAHVLDTEPRLLDPGELQRFCENVGKERDFRVTYILPDGSVLADSGAKPTLLENHSSRPEVAAALAGKERAAVRFSHSVGKRMIYFALPYRGNVLRVAVTVSYIDTASRAIAAITVAAALAILLVAFAVSTVASRRIIDPIAGLEDAAHRFSEGSLDVRVDASEYPRELAELADTLTLMASRLEEKMRDLDGQRRETEAILAGMNDALIVLDGDGRVSRANRAACALFGIDAKKARGMPLIQATRNVDIVNLASRADGESGEEEIELKTAAGAKNLLVRLSRSPDDGSAILAFGDVTRLKRLERIRKDFVGNVSHELKTPITSIQGFIETLKDGAIDDQETAKRFLGIMERQAARLGAIVNDLLALSRLEQDEGAPIPREMTPIAQVFEEARTLCADGARERGTGLSFDAPDGLEFSLNPGLIEQALVNLVDNAVKYSPQGSRVAVTARIERGNALVIEVADDGIGISEKDLDRVFERFYRVDTGRSREQGGTGLGLAIVRHIALVHGGSVSARSVEGEGSVFRIEIPAPKP